MLRAGIANQRRLVDACERLAPPRPGVKHDLTTIGKNFVNVLCAGNVKQMSLQQIDIICRALKCTPNHLLGWEEVPEIGQIMTAQQLDEIKNEQMKLRSVLEQLGQGDSEIAKRIRRALQ